jgi:Na+/H+ antiporter NhaD/arsenite permease-like protein
VAGRRPGARFLSPAALSLAALLLAIALSFSTRINVGIPALAFAWLLGTAAMGGKPESVAASFPSSLFLTLLGVTLLFAAAEANGSLERMAERAVLLARGDRRFVPVVLFAIAFVASAIGPGAVSGVALVAPLAAPIGRRLGLPPFLAMLMVANGANAGNLSPLSAVGVIANSMMAKAGLGGHEWRIFATNALAHVAVTAVVYVVWLVRSRAAAGDPTAPASMIQPIALDRAQRTTLVLIALWIVGVVAFRLPVGFSAFAAVVVLFALRAADEAGALRRVPWGAVVMVCGVATLVGLAEKAGGIDSMSALIARLSTPATVNGVVAFVTGVISTWSSTSGVVLPAFLPTVPSLVERLQGGDPLAVSLSINVGSALVDVSPLSTIGALCVGAVDDPAVARALFRQFLAWGFSMTVVGAVLCQVFVPAIARLSWP